MFRSYDVEDMYDDDLTIPQMPAFSFVPSSPNTQPLSSSNTRVLVKRGTTSRVPAAKVPPPKRPALVPLSRAHANPQEDFPFLLHDRVRILTPRHEFTGRVGVITSFIRSINQPRELICTVFFSCGTTLGVPVSQLELDPRSQLISSSLLDLVVRQARMPQPKA
ncbi:MAG: hypothetical protein H6728_17005 [Myxococcales bacterium]|nr:hypothetical protein [Myxococcales bacterium]MCB9644773.1 hypothetical protein [Myxococcales bacterium]